MSEESNLLRKTMNKRFELIKKDMKLLIPPIIVFAIYFTIGKRYLYSLCPSVVLTGLPCPGCGLTRAAFAVLRGDFLRAWELHPFIFVIGIYIVAYCIMRYALLKDTNIMNKWLLGILIALLVFYVYRMIRFFPDEAPMNYYYGSVLYNILQSCK